MSAFVVWIDGKQAKLFKLMPGNIETRVLWRKEIKHHTSHENDNHTAPDKFFHEIAHALNEASEILLVGPGLSKEHLKKHLIDHHHSALASKVVGVVTVDHPTDRQILAEARKFFKQYETLTA